MKLIIKKFVVILLVLLLCSLFAQGYEPKGSVEELYNLEYLPLLRPGAKCKMFSSYDRTGGNNDGFQGTYSKLREENGNSVIAEMEGTGCIQRMWFTHSVINIDGLLDRKGEHIMIYLDGSEKPVVDVPLEKIFSGELEQFPKPLVGSAIGGFYCYVPIPYRNGCKVVIEGTGVRFYQLTYNEFSDAEGIETFSMEMTPEKKEKLAEAVKVWSSLGNFSALKVKNCTNKEYEIAIKSGQPKIINLPKGNYMIRAIYLNVDGSQKDAALSSTISLTFDNAKSPAIEAPMAYLFGQSFNPKPFQSLLLGNCDDGYYNFAPMPYQDSAVLKIASENNFKGTIKIILQQTNLEAGKFGYFHINYFEQLPTEEGLYYPFLNISGQGHYIGVHLVTEGKWNQPIWLEGDEVFIVDGELAIHGTGTEDYFNCGWYAVNNRLNQPGALPLHGFPVYGKTDDIMQATPYRWHITDPVPYQNTIDAKIEHGAQNNVSADYRSVVFFYDVNPEQIKNKKKIPTGDECVNYISQRIWQLSSGDMDKGLEIIDELYGEAKRAENKILLEGLKSYLEGIKNPDDKAITKLDKSLREIEELIKTSPKNELYEKPKIELPTDSDNLVPKSMIVSKETLQRARYDLARKVALKQGFKKGDEIIIEVRDQWGSVTPEPYYKETEDFRDSYAKVEDVRLMGKGARFTYGNADPSYACFTPDIPKAGYYEVFTIFSYGSNANDTRYVIKHNKGKNIVPLQQHGRPGTPDRNNKIWHSLGVYKFKKGLNPEKGSVTLDASPGTAKPNEAFEYRAYADSVRFVYEGKFK